VNDCRPQAAAPALPGTRSSLYRRTRPTMACRFVTASEPRLTRATRPDLRPLSLQTLSIARRKNPRVRSTAIGRPPRAPSSPDLHPVRNHLLGPVPAARHKEEESEAGGDRARRGHRACCPLLPRASTRARPTRGVEQCKGSSEPRHGCPPRSLTLPDRALRAEPIEARREKAWRIRIPCRARRRPVDGAIGAPPSCVLSGGLLLYGYLPTTDPRRDAECSKGRTPWHFYVRQNGQRFRQHRAHPGWDAISGSGML
jgi:hypothetical protein